MNITEYYGYQKGMWSVEDVAFKKTIKYKIEIIEKTIFLSHGLTSASASARSPIASTPSAKG